MLRITYPFWTTLLKILSTGNEKRSSQLTWTIKNLILAVTEFVWFDLKTMKWNQISSTICTDGHLNVSWIDEAKIIILHNLRNFGTFFSCRCGWIEYSARLPPTGFSSRFGGTKIDKCRQLLVWCHQRSGAQLSVLEVLRDSDAAKTLRCPRFLDRVSWFRLASA